jgi:hypothetical protein
LPIVLRVPHGFREGKFVSCIKDWNLIGIDELKDAGITLPCLEKCPKACSNFYIIVSI